MRKSTKKPTKPWLPSPKMVSLLRAMANPEIKPTITAWCAEAQIDRSTYYEWQDNEDFVGWFNREWDRAMVRTRGYLDNIGLKNAASNYQYWEAMQTKYHGFVKKSDVTSKGEKIANVNISNFTNLSDEELQKLSAEQSRDGE